MATNGGYGPDPELPKPKPTLIPTINIAEATGWPAGARPKPAAGLKVSAFAVGLDHPRWMHVLPNGDVLVAETNAPAKNDSGFSLREIFMTLAMKRAGAATTSANRITLLRDTNHEGVADLRTPFIEGLNSPFGMALLNEKLYVANTDAVVAYPHSPGQTRITARPNTIVDLPAGDINHHWTKDLTAGRDGRTLCVTVGVQQQCRGKWHRGGKKPRRGAEDRARQPQNAGFCLGIAKPERTCLESGKRHALGGRQRARRDWRRSSAGLHDFAERRRLLRPALQLFRPECRRSRQAPPRPDLVATAIKPDYALGSHTASLGLTFDEGSSLRPPYRGGAFVGQHGSWNRSVYSGYKVIFVPFRNGKPIGRPKYILSGFIGAGGRAMGRPVGVTFDKTGALLVADDVANVIWQVSAARNYSVQ